MPENRQSNYDQVIENWRLKFLEMDQEELIRKFQLEADEDFELTEKTDSLQKMGKALDLIR